MPSASSPSRARRQPFGGFRTRLASRRYAAGSDRGSSAVEMVLLTPLLMVMVFGIVQTALYMHARHVLLAAAQQGARDLRTTNPADASGLEQARARTLDYLRQLGPDIVTAPSVDVGRTATVGTVVVRASAVSILPGVRLRVIARSSGPLEVFR